MGPLPDPADTEAVLRFLLAANGEREITEPSFTCPRCGRVSFHPMDLQEGYCGACHDWTGPPRIANRDS
jgi:ribosomal protein L37E